MELAKNALVNDADLTAYYKLENVNDSEGGFTLTNNNTVVFTGFKYGLGADFGASNTNKSLTVNNAIGTGGAAITLSCWVRLNTEIGSGSYGFVGISTRGIGTTEWIRFQIGYEYNSGTRRLAFSRVRNDITAETGNYTITLGTTDIYHLVMTYDGTNIRGYVNGVLVVTASASGSGGSANGHTTFSIGAHPSGTNTAGEVQNFASAIIDDVGVLSSAISGAEVLALYKEKSSGALGLFFP